MGANIGVEELFLGAAEWTSTVTEGEAQERVDLAILPSDEKWKDTYRMFQDLFADVDMSIGQILASNFTQHEISLFMLSASEILKAIQVDNTNRFRTLLQTRFRNVAPDISTKLTMLYFGLPIEPIDFSLTDMTYKMEIREPEPPRYVVDPPLHFLTAHKERNWGNEISIGELDNYLFSFAYVAHQHPPREGRSDIFCTCPATAKFAIESPSRLYEQLAVSKRGNCARE